MYKKLINQVFKKKLIRSGKNFNKKF